jgi:Protein of unknown function (DUF3617)
MPSLSHTLPAIALSLMLTQSLRGEPWTDRSAPRRGSYEITTRLELPHLERWAIDKTTTICLPASIERDKIPIPVMSENSPYAKCGVAHLVSDAGRLEYDIVCPGRGAARAHAIYTLGADNFAGRVAMVMGGKNMTMTEVQRARRIGDCRAASL